MNLPAAPRILLINVARIGDTLLVTPALRALKETWPDCHLTVWAHKKRMSVLAHNPHVDALHGFSLGLRLGLLFTGQKFDLALVYGRDQTCLNAALRCAGKVVAFADSKWHDTDRLQLVPRPEQPVHAVHERLLLPQAVGADTANYRLQYHVTPAEKAWAAEWLTARVTGRDGKNIIALQLNSFPTKAHRDWPLASFVTLAERLLEKSPATVFLVVGDHHSASAADTLARKFGESVVIAAGAVSLRQSAALMACCQGYVGVDTGPTHLAGALGLPMVALYHPAYPGRYLQPLQHEHLRIIDPFGQVPPPHPETFDMASIPAETVFNAVSSLSSAWMPNSG